MIAGQKHWAGLRYITEPENPATKVSDESYSAEISEKRIIGPGAIHCEGTCQPSHWGVGCSRTETFGKLVPRLPGPEVASAFKTHRLAAASGAGRAGITFFCRTSSNSRSTTS